MFALALVETRIGVCPLLPVLGTFRSTLWATGDWKGHSTRSFEVCHARLLSWWKELQERALFGPTVHVCMHCHGRELGSSTDRLAVCVQELQCGHFMHSHCFAQYTRYDYTCPICCKSLGDMSVYFRMIDSMVARDRVALPPLYKLRKQVRSPPSASTPCRFGRL